MIWAECVTLFMILFYLPSPGGQRDQKPGSYMPDTGLHVDSPFTRDTNSGIVHRRPTFLRLTQPRYQEAGYVNVNLDRRHPHDLAIHKKMSF